MSQTETLRDYIAMDGSVLKAKTTKELHPVNRFRVMFGLPLFPDARLYPHVTPTPGRVVLEAVPEHIVHALQIGSGLRPRPTEPETIEKL